VSAKSPCLDFRRDGGSSYRGERVVPFEEGGRRLTPTQRNELAFSTPSTQAHGRLKGMLIQQREDAVAASRRDGEPVHHATFWAARDWALRAGFSDVDVYRAAAAALALRREHGAGNVSKAMVVDRIALAASDPHDDADLLAAWEPVRAELKQAVDEDIYRLWLAPLHPHMLVDGVWTVGCPTNSVGWINDRFGRMLVSCAGSPVMIMPCEGCLT
jgi:hypothetical protein